MSGQMLSNSGTAGTTFLSPDRKRLRNDLQDLPKRFRTEPLQKLWRTLFLWLLVASKTTQKFASGSTTFRLNPTMATWLRTLTSSSRSEWRIAFWWTTCIESKSTSLPLWCFSAMKLLKVSGSSAEKFHGDTLWHIATYPNCSTETLHISEALPLRGTTSPNHRCFRATSALGRPSGWCCNSKRMRWQAWSDLPQHPTGLFGWFRAKVDHYLAGLKQIGQTPAIKGDNHPPDPEVQAQGKMVRPVRPNI